jgi:hypothetical protein
MLMSLRRMLAAVALTNSPPLRVPAARVRLNAITARTSQAALVLLDANPLEDVGVRGRARIPGGHGSAPRSGR